MAFPGPAGLHAALTAVVEVARDADDRTRTFSGASVIGFKKLSISPKSPMTDRSFYRSEIRRRPDTSGPVVLSHG